MFNFNFLKITYPLYFLLQSQIPFVIETLAQNKMIHNFSIICSYSSRFPQKESSRRNITEYSHFYEIVQCKKSIQKPLPQIVIQLCELQNYTKIEGMPLYVTWYLSQDWAKKSTAAKTYSCRKRKETNRNSLFPFPSSFTLQKTVRLILHNVATSLFFRALHMLRGSFKKFYNNC